MADQEQEEERTFEEHEARIRTMLRERASRATELRSKEREFHGLERESRYDQAEMLGAYAKTKDMKHPRDLGAAREQIQRTYLNNRGLLPKRYAISDLSFRAASTTGHKQSDKQPDNRVVANQNIEFGAAWIKVGQESKAEYVQLSLTAPEFGRRKLFTSLGKAAGQDAWDDQFRP